MDKAALVTIDLAKGTEWLKALDDSDLGISVALWVYLTEYENWRFALSSRRLDALQPSKAYGAVHDVFERAGIPLRQTPSLLIPPMKDPFIRELRRIFGKTKSVEGMRLGGQLFGDRFIEDGIAYRIR
jgi:hypothetical protein